MVISQPFLVIIHQANDSTICQSSLKSRCALLNTLTPFFVKRRLLSQMSNGKEVIQLPTPPNSQLDSEVVDQMSSMRLSPNATDSGEAVVTSTTGDAAADEPNVDPDFLMKLIQDSVKYLSAVKERLNVENRAHPESENTPKYEQFLTTLKVFKDRK